MWDPHALGWTPALTGAFAPFVSEGLDAARVAVEHQHLYGLYTPHGDLLADVSGHLRHHAHSRLDFPVAGDWVAVRARATERRATIQAVLPRKSLFARQAAGDETEEQPVAANIDTVFLVMGLDRDYNPRRFERYLALASRSGAVPIALLTKPDLCDQAEERRREIESMGAPAHVISPKRGEGLEVLASYLAPGATVALLGSSGVGKSTLINRLLGEERLKTREVRLSDNRGRHTTTHRELIVLPGGGLVIDTPGMREIQLSETADVDGTFADIAALANGCRFTNCRHEAEPACAVLGAVADGSLGADRLESHRKLQKELQHQVVRVDQRARLEQKRQWKAVHKAAKRHKTRG
ncbi:MAG: ribosome small subunit-dependent GTPase A [Vicinamibacteria bacterium]